MTIAAIFEDSFYGNDEIHHLSFNLTLYLSELYYLSVISDFINPFTSLTLFIVLIFA